MAYHDAAVGGMSRSQSVPGYMDSGRPPTPLTQLFQRNSIKSRTSKLVSDDVRWKDQPPITSTGDVDYQFKSRATMFARTGIVDGKFKKYNRCPNTGTWFLDEPLRRRDYYRNSSESAMRFTESRDLKPGGEVVNIWAAPCAGVSGSGYWRAKERNKPVSMVINSHNVRGLLANPIDSS
eukprot:TRINITY_DN63050_c0_g1_i1.p1 TRINITY_DN63050_c0_g1~~TRINITY_DN63050_c0_g1_i1.p1  ORF type:complete len:179 (-),score=26.96 TRINITY_DN63050_c0_g1_i1:137-673(-)